MPAGNPFVNRAGARPEIYDYGLRNPWRFSFDRENGDMAIADVGQDAVEEVDFRKQGAEAGINYGWRVFEGTQRFAPGSAPGAVGPVLEHSHRAGWCSIIGGYVVRDPAVPSLKGRYVYGDNCKGDVYSARLAQGGARGDHSLGLHVPSISSFGEDSRGRVYVASLEGPVYRLAARH